MSNQRPLSANLSEGISPLGLDVPEAQQQVLLSYVALLAKWNQAYNLTAIRDPAEMITRHILDSLAVAPYLNGPRVLDVGTGAGLPGIPLAVVRPELQFVLLDSNAKKTRFVTQAVGELALTNVEVVQTRVEHYRPQRKFDTVISRAYASVGDMLVAAGHLCAPGGAILAMKGVYPGEELQAISPPFQLKEVHKLSVPGLDAARHLVIISPA